VTIIVSQREASVRNVPDHLAVGQVIPGSIKNIVDYGLFVDVGGINGLLHRSKLLAPCSGDLRECFQPGMSIHVEVMNVDRERHRIELTEAPDPESSSDWPRPRGALIETLEIGQVLEGSIANIVDYGLFVDLGGVNGLLHRSKLIDRSEGDLRNRFEGGQSIWVQVSKLHRDNKRIDLAQVSDPESAREEQRARRALLDSLTVGQVIEGTITDIVDFGLFVNLGGVEGLLRRLNLFDPSEGDLNKRYQPKQPILVEVMDVDLQRQRIGLAEVVRSECVAIRAAAAIERSSILPCVSAYYRQLLTRLRSAFFTRVR
jgi:small subunit ribosomal protein S1